MQEEIQVFHDFIQRHGYKRSAQRDLILETFLNTEEHVSAEDLYRLVKDKDPTVGFTTVYRTLRLLMDSGLAREANFGDGRARYEHNYKHQHHDHLICVGCGTLIEFYSETIENMQDKIADKYKFQPTHHSLRIFGYCSNCQHSRPETRRAAG
ncbi:MAG TPA: transcriptional repressor [Blastocatellia bacterium]|nr:transcriptional repressor [Blastocatellia bacterium]